MSAAHKISARGYSTVTRGYPFGGGGRQTGFSRRRTRLIARAFVGAACGLRGWAACRRNEAACLPKAWRRQASCDAAIAANLKELGYGG